MSTATTDANAASKATGIRSKEFINAFLREFKAQARYYRKDPSGQVFHDLRTISQTLEREADSPSGNRDEVFGFSMGKFLGMVEFGIPSASFQGVAKSSKERVLGQVAFIAGELRKIAGNLKEEFLRQRIEKIARKHARKLNPAQKEILAAIAVQFASSGSSQIIELNEKKFLAAIEAAVKPGQRRAVLRHYKIAQKGFREGEPPGELIRNLNWKVLRPLQEAKGQLSGVNYAESVGFALGNFIATLKAVASPRCPWDKYMGQRLLGLIEGIAELFREVNLIPPATIQKAVLLLSRSADNEMKKEFLEKVAAQFG